MTQITMRSSTHTPTETTRMPKKDPDLFHQDISWEELCEMWSKAQRGI